MEHPYLHLSFEIRAGEQVELRQYATAALQSNAPEYNQTHDRQCSYYAALLEDGERQIRGPRQQEILAEMNAEMDNLRQAWNWMVANLQADRIQKSLRSLWQFHEIRGRFQGGATLFGQAVAVLQTLDEAGSDQEIEHKFMLGRILEQYGYFYAHLGLRYSTTNQEIRSRAEQYRTELVAQLTHQQIEFVEARIQNKALESLAQEILVRSTLLPPPPPGRSAS